jgi:hypothetical protein
MLQYNTFMPRKRILTLTAGIGLDANLQGFAPFVGDT